MLSFVYLFVVGIRHYHWVPFVRGEENPRRNRGIDTFSEEECWRNFRFRKPDLIILFQLLQVPFEMRVIGGRNGFVSGEYATLYMLQRLRYPGILADCQVDWGRDYSQLSKVFNTALHWHYDHHVAKVCGNINWYADRFDLYMESVHRKILACDLNPIPNQVPRNLSRVFGFIDGTANPICRPRGNNNMQNPYYNGYHHGHFLIWQGVSFPDGMVVIEGPFPGYFNDVMVWRDCQIRHDLEIIMNERVQENLPRLVLYADKIYNNSPLIRAAWSRRHGEVTPWMIIENSIMSKIRVAVEWTFGSIVMLFKFVSFKVGQKLLSR